MSQHYSLNKPNLSTVINFHFLKSSPESNAFNHQNAFIIAWSKQQSNPGTLLSLAQYPLFKILNLIDLLNKRGQLSAECSTF